MEENELEIWYTEEKERLNEAYFKKIDISSEEGDEEESKKGKKRLSDEEDAKIRSEARKEFLQKMEKLRQDYQKRYDVIKGKQDSQKTSKKIKKKVMKPTMIVLEPVGFVLKKIFLFLKKYLGIAFSGLFKGIKTGFRNSKYHTRNYYTFHMKKKADPMLWPFRKTTRTIIRGIKKPIAFILLWYKKISTYLIAVTKDGIEKTIEFAKNMLEVIQKYLKIVTDFLGKIKKIIDDFKESKIEPMLEPIKKIMAKFKKEDEGGGEE